MAESKTPIHARAYAVVTKEKRLGSLEELLFSFDEETGLEMLESMLVKRVEAEAERDSEFRAVWIADRARRKRAK